MTEALNVQDNMAREASSGTVSVSPLAPLGTQGFDGFGLRGDLDSNQD